VAVGPHLLGRGAAVRAAGRAALRATRRQDRPLSAEGAATLVREIGTRRLELVGGDITTQAVDAIGNAANTSLAGGGGVDGAIHRAAGPELLAELRGRYPNGTGTGTAVATDGYRLPARWVVHAVGPVWSGGDRDEPRLLSGAYRSCLRLADELGARSLALPAISMGVYGYPLAEGARIAVATVLEHLHGETGVELVRFVLRDQTWLSFAAALDELA
jgi:O-acetyl-ADP-ribose deacetylase (regulator of RNase III)